MDSLIDKANRGGFFHNNTKVQHWEYSWFTPIKVNESENVNESTLNSFYGVNGLIGSEEGSAPSEDVEKYPFQYKKWVKVDTQDALESKAEKEKEKEEPLDILNLALFDRTRKAELESKNSKITDGTLTVEDIRGAVGGSGAIPGLSKEETPATSNTGDATVLKADSNVEETVTPLMTEVSRDTDVSDSIANTPALEDTPMEDLPIVETPAENESSVDDTPLVATPTVETSKENSINPVDNDGDISMDGNV